MDIVRKRGFTVVGISVEASSDELGTKMSEAWTALLAREYEINDRTNAVLMDICLSRQGDEYLQFIGAEVKATNLVPEGMKSIEIPTQRYVHTRHVGSLPEIAASFSQIYDWAAENGCSVDDFKLDIGYTSEDNDGPHELYVRVVDDSGSH